MASLSSMTSTPAAAAVAANSELQKASQSLISGSTNSTADVPTLVSALVNAKVAGQGAQIAGKEEADKTQLTAIGTLKSVLSLLQSSLNPLADGTTLSAFTATASGKGLSATPGNDAVAGSYAVNVTSIATAQSLTSSAFGADAQLGAGTMTLSLGDKSMSIDVDASNNTLNGIASAINSASGNPGITATVINGSDGAHLVLRAATTGAANTISVSTTLADGTPDNGLSSLGVTSTPGTTDGSTISSAQEKHPWSQSVVARDAVFSIAGTQATSPSNSVSSAIKGVTLNLTADAVGTTQTLSIAHDVSGQTNAINAFVTAYNNYVNTATSLSSYDSSQKAGSQGGPLLGDSMLNTIRNTLATLASRGVGTGASAVNLASIGITLQPDGTLKTDSNALNNALANNPNVVATLFNKATGLGATMSSDLTKFLQSGGILDARTTTLNQDLKSQADQHAQLATYTAQLTSNYNQQFTSLNKLMAQMNNNSNYLTQLFGGAKSAGTLATNK